MIKLLLAKDNIIGFFAPLQKLKGSSYLTIEISLLGMLDLFRERVNAQNTLISLFTERIHKITRSTTDDQDFCIYIFRCLPKGIKGFDLRCQLTPRCHKLSPYFVI